MKKKEKEEVVPVSLELSPRRRMLRLCVGLLCAGIVYWLFVSDAFLTVAPNPESREYMLASSAKQAWWVVQGLSLSMASAMTGLLSLYLIFTGIFGEKERPGID